MTTGGSATFSASGTSPCVPFPSAHAHTLTSDAIVGAQQLRETSFRPVVSRAAPRSSTNEQVTGAAANGGSDFASFPVRESSWKQAYVARSPSIILAVAYRAPYVSVAAVTAAGRNSAAGAASAPATAQKIAICFFMCLDLF